MRVHRLLPVLIMLVVLAADLPSPLTRSEGGIPPKEIGEHGEGNAGGTAGVPPVCTREQVPTEKLRSADAEDRILPSLEDLKALIKARDYRKAADSARELLAACEEHGEGDTVKAAETIDVIVEASWRGDLPEKDTVSLARRAVDIKERLLGSENPGVATSLHHLATWLYKHEDLAGARRLYERSLAIREKVFGPEAVEVGPSLNNLASVLGDLGLTAEAYKYLVRSLNLREKILPAGHPDIATALNNLGNAEADLGFYEEAERHLRRVVSIREAALGPNHFSVAGPLNSLGTVLIEEGAFEDAETALERALAIQEDQAPKDHLEIEKIRLNIADLQRERGRLTEARKLTEDSLEKLRSLVPADSLFLARARNNYGNLLNQMGDLDAATREIEAALDVRRAKLAPSHADIAQSLTSLGNVNFRRRDLSQALNHYQEALKIREEALGPENDLVAEVIGNMAVVQAEMENLAAARDLDRRALAIDLKALGPRHPLVGVTMSNLAKVLYRLGEDEEAERLVEESLPIREAALGDRHPALSNTLAFQAGLLAEMGQTSRAIEAALRAEELGRDHLRLTARALSEREALAYASLRPSGLETVLSLVDIKTSQPHMERILDALVRARAVVLDEMAQRSRRVAETGDTELARTSESLAASSRRLANLFTRGPGKESPDRYRAAIEEARQEMERAEHALAEKSAVFRAGLQQAAIGLREILAALPPDGALVSFSVYAHEDHPALRKPARKGDIEAARKKRTLTIIAFVSRGGDSRITAVRLGTVEVVDALVQRWRAAVTTSAETVATGRQNTQLVIREAGNALRRKVWDPLAPHLLGTRLVFVVPEGSLNLLSFAALPATRGGYLLETGPLIHYLSAERDLVGLGGGRPGGRGLLAIGAPDFDERRFFAALRSPSEPSAGTPTGQPSKNAFRGERSSCGDFRSVVFGALHGAASEVDDISSVWAAMRHLSD